MDAPNDAACCPVCGIHLRRVDDDPGRLRPNSLLLCPNCMRQWFAFEIGDLPGTDGQHTEHTR